eukprot:scpid69490/ scgid17499/ HCLS1-binding protein 3; HS1-binding protein 3
MLSSKGVKEFFVGAESDKSEPPMAMFAGAALTKRSVQNSTGMDMFVPKFDTSQGAGRETLYHIIVISVMSVFKSPKHKPEDVVQFSVPRKYADFERLQEQLSQEFSAIVFPSLPPRRLYCNEDDLEDRLIAFDCLMRVVAKTTRLSRSHSVLRFLGIEEKLINRALKEMNTEGSNPASIKEPVVSKEEEEETIDIFADDDEEEGGDLALSSPLPTSPHSSTDLPDVSMHASVREQSAPETNVDDFLLVAGAAGGAAEKSTVFAEKRTDRTKELTETDADLFKFDEDLGSLDHLTKPKSKPKKASKAKAKAPVVDEADTLLTEQQFADMDLQQYIAANAAKAAEEVDLFS